MFSTTWTPRAVASESRPFEGHAWRAVEAQHVVSTLPLVDSLEEQATLEQLLEATKPPLPGGADSLHYLLATPFRYPVAAHGSRFRAPDHAGVFYGAEEQRVACAELGYWRWRFLRDSVSLISLDARPQTLFQVAIRARYAIDLREPPFAADEATWTHVSDYSGCEPLARVAREAGVIAIRYRSVRDPQQGGAIALLTPAAFDLKYPCDTQTWSLTVTQARAMWQRQSAIERAAFEFHYSDHRD